jgi:hypothetical protein
MTGRDLEDFTFRQMPIEFFGKLTRAVFAAHADAARECRAAFEPTEVVNVAPIYRRGKLEGHMRAAAAMYPQIEARVERGEGGWNHTELEAGGVVLTASTVQTPCGLVERAEFRLTLASDNQLPLWTDPTTVPPPDAPLYAILLHSRSRWDTKEERQRYGHLPGSAYLAFPTPGLGDYAHAVNLFDRFPNVVEDCSPKEWDQEVKLRFLQRARASLSA